MIINTKNVKGSVIPMAKIEKFISYLGGTIKKNKNKYLVLYSLIFK